MTVIAAQPARPEFRQQAAALSVSWRLLGHHNALWSPPRPPRPTNTPPSKQNFPRELTKEEFHVAKWKRDSNTQ